MNAPTNRKRIPVIIGSGTESRKGYPAGILGLSLALLFILSCGPAPEKTGETWPPKELRFADTGIEGLEALSLTYAPFSRALEEILGIPIRFFPVSDRTAASTALGFGQVDLVLAGPAELLILAAKGNVTPVVGLARPRYFTVFMVKNGSPMQTLADVRGSRIALKDPGSTTGHIMPIWMLVQAGLNPDRDVRLLMLDGARIEALVTGDADVLASGVRDYDRLIERFGEGSYRIIAQSPPMPHDVLIARRSLPPEGIAILQEAFLTHGDTLMQAIVGPGKLDRYEGAKFVPVVWDDYTVLRDGFAAAGIPLH